MERFDLVFAGHVYRDTIRHSDGSEVRTVGGALMYAAIAAARLGARVAVVAKLAERDRDLLSGLVAAGVRVFLVPAAETSEFEVIYGSADLEDRQILQVRRAGAFRTDEFPAIDASVLHLAGNAAGEFPDDVIEGLASQGRRLATDMQAFVRQPEGPRRAVRFGDVPGKEALARRMAMLKLDVVEARALTGQAIPAAALATIGRWGCPEVILTAGDGVSACLDGEVVFVPFTNRGTEGRNGRGDTTFGAYLFGRLTRPPREALRFAAAAASVKLERRGPFNATLEDVLERMAGVPEPACRTAP